MPKVKFLPADITVEFEPQDENLLRTAMRVGIHINASCGGSGVCNKCRVFVEDGRAEGERLPDGGWKACTLSPETDVVIRVPVESEVDRRALTRPLARRAASWIKLHEGITRFEPEPAVRKIRRQLPEPSIQDAAADLFRLKREFFEARRQEYFFEIDCHVLSYLPAVVRAKNWEVTASLIKGMQPESERLIRVEAGDKTGSHLAMSVDIGTTTISAQLIDLLTGKILSEASDYNPQISYGEDVISRMEFAKKADGLRLLQSKVTECINGLLEELIASKDLSREDLSLVTVAANTVMTHFFIGLETSYLRSHPYVPVAHHFPPLKARTLGIDVPPHVRIFFAPCVASYVGGDIVAGVVGAGINRHPELTLFIDIGTNGEIVLGNRDWMACAACSAGPAFEGGGIQYGMRATTGAVEVVHVHAKTFEPMVLTIGGKKARGICGSGIISLLAGLFIAGALDQQGKFRRDLPTARIRSGRNGWEYVVVEAESTAIAGDIVFTEADVENLIRAKGAMFAGYLTLLESVGMSLEDVERVVLAGNFGSYLDLDQGVTIGLLPDIPRDRFFFAGNSSLLGAGAAAVSWPTALEMHRVAQMMTHFDLSDNPRFMDHYVSSLFLPHTDIGLFPSVGLR